VDLGVEDGEAQAVGGEVVGVAVRAADDEAATVFTAATVTVFRAT
jgi:hypothetical protein